jgi:hypothetical protein
MQVKEPPKYPRPPIRPALLDPKYKVIKTERKEILEYEIVCRNIDIDEIENKNSLMRWLNKNKLLYLKKVIEDLEFELKLLTDEDLKKAWEEVNKKET